MTQKQMGVRAQRKAERPGEILDAAFEEFVENGYAATRVEDIAARVGVTKGAVYFYFETKEILFEEMLRHISTPFSELRQAFTTFTGPYPKRIEAFIRLTYEKISMDRNSRELLRFMIAEGGRIPHMVDRHYEEYIVPLFEAAAQLFAEGVAAGELRDCPIVTRPEIAASPGMLMTVWKLLFSDGKCHDDDEAFIEAHIDLLMNGILVKP